MFSIKYKKIYDTPLTQYELDTGVYLFCNYNGKERAIFMNIDHNIRLNPIICIFNYNSYAGNVINIVFNKYLEFTIDSDMNMQHKNCGLSFIDDEYKMYANFISDNIYMISVISKIGLLKTSFSVLSDIEKYLQNKLNDFVKEWSGN